MVKVTNLMLSGTHVALIGGDARQMEVIRKFSETDAAITLIGFDNLKESYTGVRKAELAPENLSRADALILPPVGTDDAGKVESVFSSIDLRITGEHIAVLPKHAKVYTGMGKPYLKRLCAEEHIELVELFDRDDVAIYNSIPTVEGAIMMAIQNTVMTLHSSRCMVLGMGRTGITLARALKGLGAEVKIGVRRDDHFARAWEMGLNPFYTGRLPSEVSDLDLLFNTVPAMIVTAEVIARMPQRTVIIDLASKPGGTDFRFAERRGMKALLAPGLPGIVAPQTAGRIIANTLHQLIGEEMRKRRNAQ